MLYFTEACTLDCALCLNPRRALHFTTFRTMNRMCPQHVCWMPAMCMMAEYVQAWQKGLSLVLNYWRKKPKPSSKSVAYMLGFDFLWFICRAIQLPDGISAKVQSIALLSHLMGHIWQLLVEMVFVDAIFFWFHG